MWKVPKIFTLNYDDRTIYILFDNVQSTCLFFFFLSFSSNKNRESNSDLESDSDSDLDSDTDISVGTDFPMPFSIANSSSTSSLDSIVDVRLRPGPRSFKLQQQRMKLGKWLMIMTIVIGNDSDFIRCLSQHNLFYLATWT